MKRRSMIRILAALTILVLSVFSAGAEGAEPEEKITLDNIREYVVGLDTPVKLEDGTERPMINFDNAATTPVLRPVQEAVDRELEMYGSIGRGFSQKSNHSTDLYWLLSASIRRIIPSLTPASM